MIDDENVPEFPPSELIDAWGEGFKARRMGLNYADNPHLKSTHAYYQWADGWISANKVF